MGKRRFAREAGYRSRLPVICAGNFVAGGTGKTPLAVTIAEHIKARGQSPVFLSRGYGGAMRGPVLVEPGAHRAAEVGDEPLLLAQTSRVMIARDRRAGLRAIESGQLTPDAVIMDDGLQNPTIKKDLVIALIDGARGIGNGCVIPAGPLRASMEFQLGLVDAIVVNGRGAASGEGSETRVRDQLKQRFPGPVLQADVVPAEDTGWLAAQPVLAFSGIGNPSRFFRLLERHGASLAGIRTFGDHHQFKEHEALSLMRAARETGARLVTTQKDWVRLSGEGGALGELQQASTAVAIRLDFDDLDRGRLAALVDAAVASGGYRRGVSQD
jgi:tetraacyldisaccharide 4'-kinase